MMRSAALLTAAAVAVEVTPVQKVIQMLNDMATKGAKEMQDEKVQFAAYKQFCDDTIRDKTRAIEEANEAIDKLTSDEEKASADAKRLGREIAEGTTDIANWEGDLDSMSKVREQERSKFLGEQTDYQESVSALKRAIATLKSQSHDRKQEALLQLQEEIPVSKRQKITAFLDTDVGTASLAQLTQAPLANAYEFQSGGVIEMLEKLLTKFSDELSNLQKAEVNAQHNHNMMHQQITIQVETEKDAVATKTAAKGKKEAAAAAAKSDRQDTTQTRDGDQEYLNDLSAECTTKASDFKTRQNLRAEEIDAINKAVEIMSSDKVSGAADKYLPSFVQIKTATAPLKIADENAAKQRLVNFLQAEGEKNQSRVLTQLAAVASDSPFKKVIDMIRSLVTRLQEEAAEEAERNGWCKTELAKNEKTRTQKENEVETLSADVEALQAGISKATDTIAELNEAISALDSAMAEAVALRKDENEKNTITIEESKEAQVAVGQALTVLRDFYAQAGTSTALLQQKPEIFDSPYTGMQGASGGIVGMLEVIESDFARLEADTTAAEAQASSQHDKFMTDSKVDKTEKSTRLEHTEAKKQDMDQELVQKKEDLVTTQNLLDSANAEFEKLKPSCIETGVSYEERVAKREAEIESLKEALDILSQDIL